MKLSRLIAGLPVSGPFYDGGAVDPEVTGVAHDSRRVEPGDLFVAWKGGRHDGTAFAAAAVEAGAAAVLVPEGAGRPSAVDPSLPWLTAEEPRRLLAPLAARAHRHPDRELLTTGVTGTNGKSTVAHLLQAMLESAGKPCAVVGSLGYFFRGTTYGRGRTTPEGSDLYRLLRTWRDAGAEAVSMEVSSHALAQGRVAPLRFDLAVFTNLSRDHLDFHRDQEAYFGAKRRLFDQLGEGGRAVVNAEDPYGERLAGELPASTVLTWGVERGDVRVLDADLHEQGLRARLATPRGELALESPLLGRFNLLNLVASVAGAEALELDRGAVTSAVAERGPLPGRMEPVDAGQPFPVFVDYSHTDRALAAALDALRELSERRVVVVFGCGGDRDPGKRPVMGRVAGERADVPIVTSDNPRSEDPLAVIAAVEEGLKASGNRNYRVEPDRREAIRLAAELADPDGAVLIAGKGDEPVQIVGSDELPFTDREEALAVLRERAGAA